MAAPKFKDLYRPAPEQNLRDKQKIEALRERLNRQIQSDPKKAALVLESWLRKKS